jgi:hypothetical protein
MFSSGSATLIAVSEDQALLLTCQHVVRNKGKKAFVHWAATGETGEGKVVRIGSNGLDVALVVVPRPKGLRAIPVTSANGCVDEYIINAGYPGVTGTLEWQKGKVKYLENHQVIYTCRPISGMSGGATFDKYGNQVGVIQFYRRTGGGSTSGPALMSFLAKFIQDNSKTGWYGPAHQREVDIPDAPASQLITAPAKWNDFLDFIVKEYNAPKEVLLDKDVEPTEPTLANPKTKTKGVTVRAPGVTVKVKPSNRNHCSPRKRNSFRSRRRIFRRGW